MKGTVGSKIDVIRIFEHDDGKKINGDRFFLVPRSSISDPGPFTLTRIVAPAPFRLSSSARSAVPFFHGSPEYLEAKSPFLRKKEPFERELNWRQLIDPQDPAPLSSPFKRDGDGSHP